MKNSIIHKSFIVTLALGISSLSLHASESTDHQIDRWYNQAMEKSYSTMAMRSTINKAREMWDQEMNACYKRLMARLPKTKREILKNAQRAWVTFRDADGKAIEAIISSQEGTQSQLAGTEASYQRVRDRALQLLAFEQALPSDNSPQSSNRSLQSSSQSLGKVKLLKPGSAERKAICNALRIPVMRDITNGQRVVFVIGHIATQGDTAFIYCSNLQQPNGKPINWLKTKYAQQYKNDEFGDAGLAAILRRDNTGKWHVIVCDGVGAFDVFYENWPEKYGISRELVFGKR